MKRFLQKGGAAARAAALAVLAAAAVAQAQTPPVVSSVYNPLTQLQLDPTTGGSPLCVAGANFVGVGGAPPSVTVGGAAAALLSSPSASASLVCVTLPEGWGVALPVVVTTAAGLSSAASAPAAAYTYAPPAVARITNALYAAAEAAQRCAPFQIYILKHNPYNSSERQYINKTIYNSPGCFPTNTTASHYGTPYISLRVEGASFGPPGAPLRILTNIGGDCAAQSHNHSTALCWLPSGMGDAVQVAASLGGRQSAPSAGSTFAYDAPSIDVVMPNVIDGLSGNAGVTFYGSNFGSTAAPVSVAIDGVECLNARWRSDGGVQIPDDPWGDWSGLITCDVQPGGLVGLKNLSVQTYARSAPSVYYAIEGRLEVRCPVRSYGLNGEVCLVCPAGAVCPGGELYFDLVYALPGWWRFNRSDAAQCDARRAARAQPGGPGCPALVACSPPEACLGKNVCASAYTGDGCALCAAGYVRVGATCVTSASFSRLVGQWAGIAAAAFLGVLFCAIRCLRARGDQTPLSTLCGLWPLARPALAKAPPAASGSGGGEGGVALVVENPARAQVRGSGSVVGGGGKALVKEEEPAPVSASSAAAPTKALHPFFL